MATEQVTASKYPFDLADIHAGMTIPLKVLEDKLHTKATEKMFGLKLVGLRDWILSGKRRAGESVAIKIEKGSLVILADNRVIHYAEDTVEVAVRKMKRAQTIALAVHPNKLTAAEQEVYENGLRRITLTRHGMLLGSRGKLELKPHTDNRPKLSGETK